MSADFVFVLLLGIEKFVAALVDRYVAAQKKEEERKRLGEVVAIARAARTRQEKQDAAGKITDSF